MKARELLAQEASKKARNRRAQDLTLLNLDAIKKRLDRIEKLLSIKPYKRKK